MPALLDSFPFPFSDPTGQELHHILSQLYRTGQAALFVAEKGNLDPAFINASQAGFFVWKDILELGSTRGQLRAVVKAAVDGLGPASPGRKFLDALLQDLPAPEPEESRHGDGSAKFLVQTDQVFEPEALLYHDDLTLQIGRVPALVATLQKLVTLAPAVCKLNVDFNGRTKTGTGFRIGSDLLLTNWHVLHLDSGVAASNVSAEFLYEDDGQGKPTVSRIIHCDPATIRTDKTDDWAVIQTQDALDGAWPVIPLNAAIDLKIGDPAFVIQHPSGERKRLGFVRNQVSFFDQRVAHYLTDTKEGSSGAPVFDGDGRLFALHHAGGRPQEVAGKAPLRKNEGIRISRVLTGLQAAGVQIDLS